MLVFTWFLRFIAGVFSCRHWRTRIHEGKCYCPDCGRGLIFQWAVLRCVQCHRRVESRLWFGRIFPVQRCCPHCGHADVETDWLSAPAYFQLHKAQLVLVEESGARDARLGFFWSVLAQVVGERLSSAGQSVPADSIQSSGFPRLAAPAP